MEKKKQKGRALVREHIVAFSVAFVLVVGGVFLFSRNGSSLLADITSFGSGSGSSQITDLPMTYTISNGSLYLKTTKEFDKVKTINFYIMYDAKNIILQLEKAQSPYESTYAASSDNMIYVTLFPKDTVAPNTSIYTLPLNGIVDGITISDLSVVWANGKLEQIAIQKK